MLAMCAYHVENFHVSFHFASMSSLCTCFSADTLMGREVLSTVGRNLCGVAEFSSVAAPLASTSAASFPGTFLWLAIYLMVTSFLSRL